MRFTKKYALRVLSDRSGNAAIIFAIALLPMIGMVGIGIDTGRTFHTKASLDAAADAGALAAATQAEATLRVYGTGSSGLSVAQLAGTMAGQKLFGANATKAGGWIGSVPSPNVTVTINGQMITSQVTYSATVPTVFSRIFGARTMPISGLASSSLKMPTYLNISVAVDVSQSMGLASTDAYMTQLKGLTGGCAFGCHVYANGQAGTDPYEKVAHDNGIKLRVDVIREATQSMISTAQSQQGSSGMISFALYTIQGGIAAPFTTLSSSSTDYAALRTAANGIDLGDNNAGGVGDTDYDRAMPLLTSAVPVSGNGASQSAAQQFVFLMTDGVKDIATASNCVNNVYGHCTAPFDPAQCAALKAKGVTVGVIYTTYLAMPDRAEYTLLVESFANQIAPKLQACASPGWFYEAGNATEIQAAINTLFAKATGRGVLTQ